MTLSGRHLPRMGAGRLHAAHRLRSERRVDVAALKQRWPLEELAAHSGVRLRGHGRRLYGLCPFHEDRTPSLVVYPESNSFYCFGCGTWGDPITWVMLLESVDFRAACERLGAGLPAVPFGRERGSRLTCRSAEGLPAWVQRVLRAAADVYHGALLTSASARAYLRTRGIAPPAISRAWLGYAAGGDLTPGLQERGVSLSAAREAGLLTARGTEFLSGRLVVPVIVDGQVVTMTGRALRGKQTPRYLDLPLPPHLLGLDLVRGQRRLLVTEGVTDWLVALGWGLVACSPMGSQAAGATRQELLTLATEAELVVLAFDHDPAGQRASREWCDLLGPRAAPIAWPAEVSDLGDLGPRPDGRERFLHLLASAEAGWRAHAGAGARTRSGPA